MATLALSLGNVSRPLVGGKTKLANRPASIAQWIRRRPSKPKIAGSIPARGIIFFLYYKMLFSGYLVVQLSYIIIIINVFFLLIIIIMKVTLNLFIKTYLIALATYLLLDGIWLPLTNKPIYNPVIKAINGGDRAVRWIGGLVAWKLLALIICIYGLWHRHGPKEALLGGLLIGLVTYGVFNGTNYAIFPGWTAKVSIYDTLWGMSASALVSLVVYYYLKPKK